MPSNLYFIHAIIRHKMNICQIARALLNMQICHILTTYILYTQIYSSTAIGKAEQELFCNIPATLHVNVI